MAGQPGRSGGPRKNAGGARPGAGRPKKEKPPPPPPVAIAGRDMLALLQDVALGNIEATALQVRAAIAALADYDDRRRAAQQATWQRAAHVVDYYTGRDLDLMDEEYTKETAR